MVTFETQLTAEERILIHLLEFVRFEKDFEAPFQTTQEGVADAVGIHRKHIPRNVKKLIEKVYISERSSHVVGGKQKRKTYFLSREGISYAQQLRDHVFSQEVTVIDGGEESLEAVEKVVARFPPNTTLLHVLSLISADAIFDPSNPPEKPEPPSSDDPIKDRLKIYEVALSRAWLDGTVTFDENAILEDLRHILKITGEEHTRMEEQITENRPEVILDRRQIYQATLATAWSDGTLHPEEEKILDHLRSSMQITDHEHMLWEKEILKQRSISNRDLAVYRAALEQALMDDKLTQDEEDILGRLRTELGISSEDHQLLLDAIRAAK